MLGSGIELEEKVRQDVLAHASLLDGGVELGSPISRDGCAAVDEVFGPRWIQIGLVAIEEMLGFSYTYASSARRLSCRARRTSDPGTTPAVPAAAAPA